MLGLVFRLSMPHAWMLESFFFYAFSYYYVLYYASTCVLPGRLDVFLVHGTHFSFLIWIELHWTNVMCIKWHPKCCLFLGFGEFGDGIDIIQFSRVNYRQRPSAGITWFKVTDHLLGFRVLWRLGLYWSHGLKDKALTFRAGEWNFCCTFVASPAPSLWLALGLSLVTYDECFGQGVHKGLFMGSSSSTTWRLALVLCCQITRVV